LERERAYLESVDDDSYQHVWLGKCRQVSDAIILRGKFVAEEFEVRPEWSGPHHGLDYGFSRDPSAAVRLYVDDERASCTSMLNSGHSIWTSMRCPARLRPQSLASVATWCMRMLRDREH
jgi:hypothetical protein